MIDKIYLIAKTKKINFKLQCKIAVLLGLMGYSAPVPYEVSPLSIIAAHVQRQKHPGLEKIESKELVKIVSNCKDYELLCEMVAVFAKNNTDVDWDYLKLLYQNNHQLIESQPHRIAFAWSLKSKVSVNFDTQLITVTEKGMIDEINQIL